MPSLFPELFNYSQLAPLFLRIFLALVLISPQKEENKIIKWLKIIIGIFLFSGLFVQPAAILLILVLVSEIIIAKKNNFLLEDNSLRISMIVISLSLLFLGPGILSFDLPL